MRCSWLCIHRSFFEYISEAVLFHFYLRKEVELVIQGMYLNVCIFATSDNQHCGQSELIVDACRRDKAIIKLVYRGESVQVVLKSIINYTKYNTE